MECGQNSGPVLKQNGRKNEQSLGPWLSYLLSVFTLLFMDSHYRGAERVNKLKQVKC